LYSITVAIFESDQQTRHAIATYERYEKHEDDLLNDTLGRRPSNELGTGALARTKLVVMAENKVDRGVSLDSEWQGEKVS
jgi:hypothetical protein